MSQELEKTKAENTAVEPHWEIAATLPAATYDDYQDKDLQILNPLNEKQRRWIRRQNRVR